MAGKTKRGFPFYRTDTDRYQDRKIRTLKRKFGCAGVAVFDFILADIYGENGYYVDCTDDLMDDIADYWNIEPEEVAQIVKCCVDCGLFDAGQYEDSGVLTSLRIQEECQRVNALMRRKCTIMEQYNLLPEASEEKVITSEGNTISSEEIGTTYGKNDYRDKIEIIDKIKDKNIDNKCCCLSAQEREQQRDVKSEIERYFFAERRFIKCQAICERYWDLNDAYAWRSPKTNKPLDPIKTARLWKPAPEEMGGHQCADAGLAGKYYDFAKLAMSEHPDAGKLLTGFIDISVSNNEVNFTFNSDETADICETILQNQNLGAKGAFSSIFGAKTLNYIIAE